MQKKFILMLGLFLGSRVPLAGQTSARQFVPVQGRIAPIATMLWTVPAPMLATSFQLSENPGTSASHFSYQFAGAYEPGQGLEGLRSLLAVRVSKTLFLTQSSLPLVQFWGGRLHLDGFTGMLHMQRAQLGPSIVGGPQNFLPPRQSDSGGSDGISLNFTFGREAQIGHPTQIWRRLAQIAGAAR